MGMFDYVKCEYPLPDAPNSVSSINFQTKSFGDGFDTGYMDNYTITSSGTLVLHKVTYELVPEEKRPYYGKPIWNSSPIYQLMGCMKTISIGDEEIKHHGIVNIYEMNIDTDGWYEWELEFTKGKVTNVKRIYREFG